jgi:RND family efflux transporter MFP subunit
MNSSTTPTPFRSLFRLRRKSLLAFGAVGASALAVPFVASRTHASTPQAAAASAPAPKVTVAPVESRELTEFEELTGHVDAVETVELRARVSGHLESVNFHAGQLVQKGDVLFTVDSRWYQAQYDLAAAQAELAESEANRAKALQNAAAVSAEEAEAKISRAAAAHAQLELARLDLDHTAVRAPISGRISRAYVTPGNLVSGSPGSATLLATVVATGDAYVYADVDENTYLKFSRLNRDHNLLTSGGRIPVDLQLADESGYPRHGYIESADNRVNPSTGSLALRMVFPNPDDALVPGLFARVRIPISAPRPTLLVSERAIGTDQGQKFVLALDRENKVAYRTVRLGGVVAGKRIVRDGLNAGDTVVVNGLQRIRPGMTVSPEPVAISKDDTHSASSGRTVAALH